MTARGTRILISASSFGDAAAALDIVHQLSEQMIGQLGGVLIDEGSVTAACQLPNQRVISASGAVIMAPSPAQVRRLIKADARAFREMLAQVARTPDTKWTFEQQSGDLIDCSINLGRAWDMVILGHRELHPVPGNVVFLGSPLAQADTALDMAGTLARNLGTGLLVFSFSGAHAEGPRTRTHQFADLVTALSQLARANAQVVVIDLTRGPVRTQDQLREVVEMARCPVVVLGAGSVHSALGYSIHIPPVDDRQIG